MQVYDVVVLQHTKDDDDKITDSKIVHESRQVAVNEKTVLVRVARSLDQEVVDDFENVELLIRPF